MVEPVKKRVVEEAEEVEPAIKKPKVLKFESTYLRSVPAAKQYEKSFMHREAISHAIATETDFIVTASTDGHLKFWKKKYGEGVEFVKHFRCHLHAFSDICVNFNGTLLATVCEEDKSVKIFDVVNFDMINMLKLNFTPKKAAWIHQESDLVTYLAVTSATDGSVAILDGKGSSDVIQTVSRHSQPVRLIEYSHKLDIVVSIDEAGMVELWSGAQHDFDHPESVKWQYKMDTDLYEFMKVKTLPCAISINPNGKHLATYAEDRRIRIFNLVSGKMTHTIDDTMAYYQNSAKAEKNFGLQNMEWNRRLAMEKDLDREKVTAFRNMRICWDYSGNFLLYPTIVGVKVYNLVTEEVVREIGKDETVRMIAVSLCRAVPDIRDRLQGAAATLATETADNPTLNKINDPDPIMVCAAYKKNRFYLFTNAEPFSTEEDDDGGSSRDVFNEKPKKEDQITAIEEEGRLSNKLNEVAVLHTTMGDVHIKLFGMECPRTVENFCTLSRRGYYNGLTFHRVIKSFMIQTGDPTGKGTGGQSIWGQDFEDEFHPRLRHEKPFMVSMANAGPNSNGSQFFITVCPADWLDGKNTLFGEVVEGMNVVQRINAVDTFPKSGRPKTEIKIVSVSLK